MATRGRKPSVETQVARAAVALLHESQAADQKPTKAQVMRRFRNRYDAAGNGKRLAGWNPPSSGPNRAIEGLQTIRNRARDSSRNDWTGASANQKWSTTLVGIGITPRFKRIKSKTRKQAITDLWTDFVRMSDADCVLDFYGQETLVVESWLDAGEVFVRRRPRFDDEGLPVPLQVQLLEAEMVPIFDSTRFGGLPAGHVIKSGIEVNKRGRRVAYWVYKEHPGDTQLGLGTAPAETSLVRVLASDMRHIYKPLRPGQMRGVSQLAPVLNRLRNIENYDDATLTRQQLANLVVAFISRELPPLTGEEDINGITGTPNSELDADGAGRPLVGLQPGLVQTLDDGEKVEWSNPPEAGTTYSDYMRTQHMGTAAGAGIPYELFSGDIKEVSDRTLRVLVNEFRRLAEQRQWQVIIPMFCVTVMEWFADAALLAGEITADEYDDVRRAEWSPHGWAHIHPVQDPQGKLLEVEGGLRSRSSVIGQMGDDPDQVDEERAADKEREDRLGLTPVAPDGSAPADPNDPEDETPEEARDRRETAQANTLLRAFERFEARASQEPVAPTINATINVPPTNVTINNSVEPTPVNVSVEPAQVTVPPATVTVNNSVEPTPVNVSVAAPNVEVHNEVQPAEVKVNLPKRQTDTTVTRDGQGNITKTHQVEQDLE